MSDRVEFRDVSRTAAELTREAASNYFSGMAIHKEKVKIRDIKITENGDFFFAWAS